MFRAVRRRISGELVPRSTFASVLMPSGWQEGTASRRPFSRRVAHTEVRTVLGVSVLSHVLMLLPEHPKICDSRKDSRVVDRIGNHRLGGGGVTYVQFPSRPECEEARVPVANVSRARGARAPTCRVARGFARLL